VGFYPATAGGKSHAVRRFECRMIPCAEPWDSSIELVQFGRHFSTRTPLRSKAYAPVPSEPLLLTMRFTASLSISLRANSGQRVQTVPQIYPGHEKHVVGRAILSPLSMVTQENSKPPPFALRAKSRPPPGQRLRHPPALMSKAMARAHAWRSRIHFTKDA